MCSDHSLRGCVMFNGRRRIAECAGGNRSVELARYGSPNVRRIVPASRLDTVSRCLRLFGWRSSASPYFGSELKLEY